MATVYRARDRLLARDVAVKVIHPATLARPGMRERFLREARSAASFTHRNALAIYDIGRDGRRDYIVMELVDGCSLADVLARRGRLPQQEAIATVCQVADALAAAHRRKLVHRDVKPANILLPGCEVPATPTAEHGAKLADFGIAKALAHASSDLTGAGIGMGTPKYVSPEQAGGEETTPASDVYGLGVVLYESLAGEAPFESTTAVGLALAHRHEAVPSLRRKARNVDPSVAAVVHRALAKDPGDRYPDAGAFRDALVEATSVPQPLSALDTPDEQWQPATRRSTRHHRSAVLVAALAIALVAAGLAVVGFAAANWSGLLDSVLTSAAALR